MSLKTDYKDDILDSSVNVNRTFSIIDNTTGQIIYPNVSLEETTVFSQEGDSHTSQITNEQNANINQINERVAGLGYQNGLCSNALLVTRTDFDASNNRCDYVLSGSTSNLPSDCLVGIREVIPMDNEGSTGRVIVRISGLDSNSNPAMWINILNTSAWTGWKKVGGSMKVLAYGTTTGTKTIPLGTTLDPSKYMVNLNVNGYLYKASDGAVSWGYGYGQGAYVSAKTNTSVTIVVSSNLTASYEIIQIAD